MKLQDNVFIIVTSLLHFFVKTIKNFNSVFLCLVYLKYKSTTVWLKVSFISPNLAYKKKEESCFYRLTT